MLDLRYFNDGKLVVAYLRKLRCEVTQTATAVILKNKALRRHPVLMKLLDLGDLPVHQMSAQRFKREKG